MTDSTHISMVRHIATNVAPNDYEMYVFFYLFHTLLLFI